MFFSPGTITICCACAHPITLGFVVLDKREGPLALLKALLPQLGWLPHFVFYVTHTQQEPQDAIDRNFICLGCGITNREKEWRLSTCKCACFP